MQGKIKVGDLFTHENVLFVVVDVDDEIVYTQRMFGVDDAVLSLPVEEFSTNFKRSR